MLHIAPEHCFIKRFEALNHLDYITADLESPLAQVKMDVHDIPFEDESFDIIFCNHVMEHVADDKLAAREMHRVLKPGAWAILMIPHFHPLPDETYEDPSITSAKDREKAFGQDDHVRLYGKDYPKRLEGEGFKVQTLKCSEILPADVIERYALPKDEIIYRADRK